MLASSLDALNRLEAGQTLTGSDAAVNITLMPPELIQVLFVELPPDATADQISQSILGILKGVDGSPLPQTHQVATAAGQAWIATAATGDGAFVVLPLSEGTSAVATVLVGPNTKPSAIDDLTRELVESQLARPVGRWR